LTRKAGAKGPQSKRQRGALSKKARRAIRQAEMRSDGSKAGEVLRAVEEVLKHAAGALSRS
jgi:hypothetical protein